MSNTFTAKELPDFYQKVADGIEAEYRNCLNKQRIKPAKKVIDLSVLVKSGIDCEFRDDIGECPLPEGFEVKVWLRGDTLPKICVFLDWVLQKHSSKDIIAFEVIGIADGYVMPWEQDND